jgi:hypothetical protein
LLQSAPYINRESLCGYNLHLYDLIRRISNSTVKRL